MMRRMLFGSFLILGSLGLAQGADRFCSASYITDKLRGEETVDRFGRNFQAISVFAYDFDGDGRIQPKSPWVPQQAAARRLDSRLILVTQVNDVRRGPGRYRSLGPGEIVQALLSDAAKRAELIRQLVAVSALADGVEIDYEHLREETRLLYTLFLKELRTALPAGKKLSVVIQPKTDNLPGKYGRAIDWRAIEPYVDWIRIMAYYYSFATSPPGPVVSDQTLRRIALYSLNDPQQGIPRAKGRILLSLYGWDWPVAPAGRGLLIPYGDAMAIVAAQGITPARDPASGVLRFQYNDSSGTTHEVWVDDAESVERRVKLLMGLNYPNIDFWHLNTGDPRLWDWLQTPVSADCPNLKPAPPSESGIELTRVTPAEVRSGSQTVTLSVEGRGFSADSVVLLGGAPHFPVSTSSSTLTLSLGPQALSDPQALSVEVSDKGRLSNPLVFRVVGTPVADRLDPGSSRTRTDGLTLRVFGRQFEPRSAVRWIGFNRPTTFLSDTELAAQIAPEDLRQAGNVPVTVWNPTAGAESNALIFELGAEGTAAVFSEASVYPNPWIARRHEPVIHFTKVGAGSTVKIFTVSGRHVRTLGAPDGNAEWDLKNAEGRLAASGYYFYLLASPQGEHQRGKLALVR
jgi:spore germination protein